MSTTQAPPHAPKKPSSTQTAQQRPQPQTIPAKRLVFRPVFTTPRAANPPNAQGLSAVRLLLSKVEKQYQELNASIGDVKRTVEGSEEMAAVQKQEIQDVKCDLQSRVAQSHSSLRDAIACGQERSDEIVTKLVTLGDAIESLTHRLATLENTIRVGESDRSSQHTAQQMAQLASRMDEMASQQASFISESTRMLRQSLEAHEELLVVVRGQAPPITPAAVNFAAAALNWQLINPAFPTTSQSTLAALPMHVEPTPSQIIPGSLDVSQAHAPRKLGDTSTQPGPSNAVRPARPLKRRSNPIDGVRRKKIPSVKTAPSNRPKPTRGFRPRGAPPLNQEIEPDDVMISLEDLSD